MAFNFPDGASNGDTHTASNGVKYRFDGTVWVVDRPSTTTSFEAKYLDATGDDVVSGSAQVKSLLPAGTLSSSQFQDTGITGSLTVDSDVNVAQYIKHTGDVDTFINFTDNRIRFKAGDIGFLDMEKDASTPYPFTVNQGGNRINFRVMDRNTDLLLKTDSEEFNVKLYHAGNQKLLTKSDGIEVLGNVSGSAASTGSFGFLEASNILFESDENGDIMPL